MTPGPVTPEPPRHPLPALTTYELSRYRRELERALRGLPGHAPARRLVQQQLAEVMNNDHDEAERTGVRAHRQPSAHPARARPASPAQPGPPGPMTVPAPGTADQLLPGDLPARVFRALYPGFDLHAVGAGLRRGSRRQRLLCRVQPGRAGPEDQRG
jgi:hypothetical protein